MALNKDNKTKTNDKGANTPAFEDEGNTAVAEKAEGGVADTPSAEAGQAAAEVNVTPEAAQVAGTAIAKAVNTSVASADAAKQAKAFQAEMDAMKGDADFSWGNFRVFKASNGEIVESGGAEDSLGRWAKVRLLAYDNHFEVSPGEQGASTKDFVAYSKDGKIIDSVVGEEQKSWAGKTVAEYLKNLVDEEGFENAKCREFIDTSCALLGTDNGDGPIGTVIQVTLAQSSMTAFTKYQQDLKNAARCVAMGIPGFKVPEDPFTFFFLREAAKKGDNAWTKLKIVAELPTKL